MIILGRCYHLDYIAPFELMTLLKLNDKVKIDFYLKTKKQV
jgi:hypothetical protein